MESHARTFQCLFEACSKQLSSLQQLVRHMILFHASDRNCRLRCHIDHCAQLYSTSESYRKHVERAHRIEFEGASNANCSFDVYEAGSSSAHFANNSTDFDSVSSDEVDIVQLMNGFSHNMCMFALRIREQFLLPKSTCSAIVNDVSSLFNNFHENFVVLIKECLLEAGYNFSGNQSLCSLLQNDFQTDAYWLNACTDAKLKRFCKTHLGLVEPIEVVLGTHDTTGKKQTCQYIPIIDTIKRYIEHEDVWSSLNRHKLKQPECLYDYSDGEIFQNHKFFSEKPTALRLHFYIDDVELCNPLGGAKKKHSIAAIYFQIGNIEQKYLSSLSSIHVACLVKSVHLKKYGLHLVAKQLFKDIAFLESVGVEIQMDGQTFRLFGSLATVAADNLASHDIGGFRMCFSSGRFCRFCMVVYKDKACFTSESDEHFPKLRNAVDHDKHVSSVLLDSRLTAAYGVAKQSDFDVLESFHVTTALPADCMHDLLEGVIPIVLKVCLQGLISSKILSITVINDRLQLFKFGQNESKNAPPLLSVSFSRSDGKISGSASQKWCFFVNLAFLVGDLITNDNKYWDLYILCRKITEIIFLPTVAVSQIPYLDQLISDHHSLFIELSPDNFVPKFHFVTHYPRLMCLYGPLRNLWCMRFEGYHQYLKSVAQAVGNFKNICYTLAERNQMRKCFEQSSDNCLKSNEINVVQSQISVRSLPKLLQKKIISYFGCSAESNVIKVKCATVNGICYKVKDYLVLDIVHSDVPVFFKISHVVAFEGIWGLVGNLAIISQFLSHYQAYVIDDLDDWLVIEPGRQQYHTALDMHRVHLDNKQLQAIALHHSVIRKPIV